MVIFNEKNGKIFALKLLFGRKMASPAIPSFTFPKESFNLPLAELRDKFALGVSVLDGRTVYAIVPKDAAGAGFVERIADDKFIRLIKLAANHGSLSLRLDLTGHRDFQMFARCTKDAECPSSKLHRAVEKASYLGKGLVALDPSGKALDPHYWQEAVIPTHPSGAEVADFFDAWETSRSTLSFEDWLMQRPARLHPPSVTYLNAEERKAYAITFVDGKVYQAGHPLCTDTIRSDKNDKSAIYVILPDHVMYVGPYLLSKFQHSSFNSGQPVIGAGEIKTDATGTITEISSKSGHYKPNAQQLLDTLEFLKAKGIDLTHIHLIENSARSITRHPSAEVFLATLRPEDGSVSPTKDVAGGTAVEGAEEF